MTHSDNGNQERRNFPRIKRLWLVSFISYPAGADKVNTGSTPVSIGRTLDISASGARVEVYQDVAVGSSVEIEISMDENTLIADGKIVRKTDFGNELYTIVIQFLEIQDSLIP